ncbi:MAG: hypothetical protein EU542_06020 [Promethearchaeota archaeon]|nr:MAG: hypothetical protein EU542_06020 [Candidatus Lokiarchaeota archaeon]
MFKLLKQLYYKRKAVSPVIASLLLIALTVSTISFVYILILPYFNKRQLSAAVYKCKDTDKDSRYDQITVLLANSGTATLEISEIEVWTCPKGLISDDQYWTLHTDWSFSNPGEASVNPSEIEYVKISSDDQIVLTVSEQTYYRLEIDYSGSKNPYYSDWKLLNDQVDFADLISDFENFDLQAWGFEGTIDVPGWSSNNYKTTGGPEFGPLLEDQYVYLPVIDQNDYVPFYITGKIVIFHSTNGNLTNQPKVQTLNRTENPIRAKNLFVLGLAGSWGDEFKKNKAALTITITYTDDSSTDIPLGHDYIDDWWYDSNQGGTCNCDDSLITEIDLGTQTDWPYEPIHTHTAGFSIDFYKYVKSITFTDPGNDQSGPHLLSLTMG